MSSLCCGGAVAQVPVAVPGQTAVGHQAAAIPVVVTMTAAGSGAVTSAVTRGVSGIDFSVVQGTACNASISYQVGAQCTVSVVFAPKFPGLRKGAVVVTGSDGHLMGSTLLSGQATGSLAVLTPGEIQNVAGDGGLIYRVDNVSAVLTSIYLPQGVSVDSQKNLIICDTNNNRIRRVDGQSGLITTIAGTGGSGYSGDGGAATSAQMTQPAGLVLDGAGNIYFADSGNNIVRRIDAISGVITTVAGVPTKEGYTGDAGAATLAELTNPRGVALDAAGNLYIADTGNNVVRMVSAATGIIKTVAGTGTIGYTGDSQAAVTARLNTPWSLAFGPDGSLYIADLTNNVVRKVNPAGVISTAAGTGYRSFSGDGGSAIVAGLNNPAAVALNPAGDLYIADSGNNRVRKVDTSGMIQTVVGSGSSQFTGDGGPANQAGLYAPYAIFFSENGDMYVSDMLHNRIRLVSATPTYLQYPDIRVSKTSAPQIQGVENDGNDNLLLSPPAFVNAALDPNTTTCLFGVTIALDTACNLGVEFAPTTIGANVLGSVTLPSNAGNSPTVIDISGQVLSVDPVTVTLTSSLNPSMLGAAVTFTAAIASDDPNVSGPVTFLDGTTAICSNVPLSSGVATCSTSSLTLGQHSMTASYAGDTNNEAKVSSALVQVVQQSTAVTLAASPNPAVVTTSVGMTVTVSGPSGTPTGTVILYDGTTAISGSLALNAGVSVFSTTQLAPGTHSLTAQYSGDTNDAASTSAPVSEVVTQTTTTTTLSTSNGSPTVGTAVTFTATSASANGSTLTGTVQFTDGANILGTQSIGSNGTAALTVSSLAPGTHAIVATYSGDRNDAGSASFALTETIQQIPTATTLTSDAGSLKAGATVHLTASVAISGSAAADGAITGSVTFTDGAATLGSVVLDANGQATLAALLPAGTQNIVATYAGSTNYMASTSGTLVETVSNTSTTTTLSGSASSILAGKPVTFTAVISSSTGVPTGTVSFTDGTAVLGVAALNQGIATYTTSSLSVASHTITATYSGDSNYITSKSSTFPEVVSLATTSATLTGPAKVDVTTTVTLTGTLTSNGITPTGPLTLLDGGTAILTQNVGASGSFVFTTAALGIGTHVLSVSYGGDGDNAGSVSPLLTLVVQQAPTTTSLASSVNPSTLGQPVTLTATVTSDAAGISGSISFMDGSTLVGSAALANGTATLATSSLTFGMHTLTAVYTGDTNHSVSTSAALSEQIVESATATITSSLNPAASGNNVVFTAHLAPVGSLVPTGSVIFHDGSNALATVALDATGTASFQSSTLGVGTHNISLSYAGDGNYAAATAALIETIQNANTQIVLTSSGSPATYGAPLSLTATVTSNGGIATGSVTFTDGTAAIGSAVLNANGVATLTTSTLAPGVHSIVATYAGDGKAGGSVSTPVTITVLQTTSIIMASSANPALTLGPVVLTATVSGSVGKPTGSATFTDGATQLGVVTLDVNGVASLTVAQMSAGVHAMTVSYGGDAIDFPSNAKLTETVQLRPTTASLTSSQTDPANPQKVTLIAVVLYAGPAAATGTVTFTTGGTTIGSAPVSASGLANYTFLMQGTTEPVIATYSGDTAYSGSNSATTTVTAGAPTQFTLSLSSSTMTMQSKQHGTITLTATSVKDFTDTLEFGCLGEPFAATCTFSNTQVKLAANGTATVQLTIDTGNPLGAGSATAGFGSGRTLLISLPLILFLSFGLWRTGRRRRALPALLLTAFAVLLTLSATGCAGLSVSGTPPGTYTFLVTAVGQGSGATQSQTMTMTVTQ